MTKKKTTLIILSLLSMFCAASAVAAFSLPATAQSNISVRALSDDDSVLSEDYLAAYSCTADGGSAITDYEANGGSYTGHDAANALDGKFSTFWETNTPNSQNFTNRFTVAFDKETQIERIVYATRQDNYKKRGYPRTLTVYASSDDTGENFAEAGVAVSAETGAKVLFTLPQTVSCKRIRFEFTDVYSDIAAKYASAAEFIFLKTEGEAAARLRDLFADYRYTQFVSGISADEAARIVEEVKRTPAYTLDSNLAFLADRAQAVIDGETLFEEAREFTTGGKNAEIRRMGNVAQYAQNTLKMIWMGTNRQPTGISAAPNEMLTVFVDCEEGDPLPSIVFTQHLGRWNKWKSGEYKLQTGINHFTVPDLYDAGWTVKTAPGGPVYLINPYTAEEQSDSVRIYIEGGYTFPVYREGGDEAVFLADVASFLEAQEQSPDNIVDAAEIQSDNVILTLSASQVKAQCIDGKVSPEKVCKDWDDYVFSLLDFAGVALSPSDGGYDSRAPYINVNVRIMQPWAAAYAFGEHVGIQKGSWESTVLTGAGYYGWGFAHELGHMMDISERTVSETTNNMWSQFDQAMHGKMAARGEFAAFTAAAAPDNNQKNAYGEKMSAALPWWNIESRYPGFWGAFENCYRYENRAGMTDSSDKTKAELHVYFASLAAGTDLSYYFERIGFYWGSGELFTGENASQNFKTAIQAAKDAGRLSGKPLKFWYYDANQYLLMREHGDKLALYDGQDSAKILNVSKNGNSYGILLPETDALGHLGYEILRSADGGAYEVIGFTQTRAYTDTSAPEGDVLYKVRAYDRLLSCTAESAAAGVNTEKVARVNGTDYTDLAEAVNAAGAGDTVYLLCDLYASGVTVAKAVTVRPLSGKVTLMRDSAQALFTVAGGGALTLECAENGALTLDGMRISSASPMIESGGTLTVNAGVTLQNAVCTGNGGAVRLTGGTANLNGCVFSYNSAADGGAVATAASGCRIYAENATFLSCTATQNGGALYSENNNVFLTSCTFEKNAAQNGGAVYLTKGNVTEIKGCSFTENTAENQGGGAWLNGKTQFLAPENTFIANSAKSGGGIFVQSENSNRTVTAGHIRMENNEAERGGGIYAAGYLQAGTNGGGFSVSAADTGEGSALYIAGGAVFTSAGTVFNLSGGLYLAENKVFSFSALPDLAASSFEIRAVLAPSNENLTVFSFPSALGEEGADSFDFFIFCGDDIYKSALSEDGTKIGAGTRYYAITVTDGQASGTQYIAEGDTFTLPDAEGASGMRFVGWKIGDKLYAAGDAVTANAHLNAVAVYEPLPPETGGGDNEDGENGNGSEGNGDNSGNGNEENNGTADDPLPAWPFVVGGILLVAVIGGAVLLLIRKK